MAPKRPPTTSPEKSSLQVTRRCHAVASLTKDPRMHTEQTNMSAPTQPAPSKPKPETKKGGGIANFIVNNENSVMSVEHQPGQTPFDNSGLLPQWKVENARFQRFPASDLYAEPTPSAEDIKRTKAGKAPVVAVPKAMRDASSQTEAFASSARSQPSLQPVGGQAPYNLSAGAAPDVSLEMQRHCEDSLAHKVVDLHRPITNRMTEQESRMKAFSLLCNMPAELVQEIICGNVAHASLAGNNKIQQLFHPNSAWMGNYSAQVPYIYMRAFCDTRTGRSLTLNELKQVLHWQSLEIDLVFAVEEQHAKEGCRKFLNRKFADEDASNRTRQVLEWLEPLPPLVGDTPLAVPLSYVGFAMNSQKSKAQLERTHNPGSSWFMSLFLATCEAVLGDGNEIWGFRSFDEGAYVGKALLTVLLAAWYRSDTGFGNTFSVEFRTTPHLEVQRLWHTFRELREQHTPYQENLDLEYPKIEAFIEKKKQPKAKHPDPRAEAQAICQSINDEEQETQKLAKTLNACKRSHEIGPDTGTFRVFYSIYM
ncbi:hypothetical protein J3E72DRAFT_395185 [Bipolaris maydis]|nr:hypothetical protein J3E72DRAFT_395185 [Bipolaris maydis]